MNESTQLFLEAKLTAPSGELTGKEWEVVIIGQKEPADLVTIDGQEFLKSKNGRLYWVNALRESVPYWEGIKVYDNHLTPKEYDEKMGMRSPANEWLGTIVKPRWDEAKRQLRGVFKVVEERLAQKLKSAWEQGVLDTIGLSIDTFPMATRQVMYEGVAMPIIEGFKKILSVDLVGDPAAGGGFERILAANINFKEHNAMDEKLKEEIQTMITAGFSELKAGIPGMVQSTIAEALAADVEDEPTPEAETVEEPETAVGNDKDTNEPETPESEVQVDDTAKQALQEARLARCELQLVTGLTEAKLPDAFAKPVREAFAGRVFEPKELDNMVKQMKEAWASTDPSGQVNGAGSQRPLKVWDSADKKEVAYMQKIMGGDFRRLEGHESELVQERLTEAWNSWKNNGKQDLRFDGRLSELLRTEFLNGAWTLDDERVSFKEALTLATVIKNTVNIMTALDYAGSNRWYEPVVDMEETDNPIDDMTLARLFGADELDVVNKGAAYTEMVLDDEEETAAHVKQGNYVAVALEDLMADKIGYIRSLPTRLADAWYNTLSAKVAAVFTTNTAAGPVLSDSGALFNATAVTSAGGHANLLTSALSFASFDAVMNAMYAQTARPLGTGRKLIDMGPFTLLVPTQLRTTSNQILNSEKEPDSMDNNTNPYYKGFSIVQVPDWTDANDWAMMARYRGRSPIKLFFPRGMRTPQILTADGELAGSMFTNDTIRYKLRMMTYRFSSTYDCAPVADWRLLHKSNV